MSVNNTLFSTAADKSAQRAQTGTGPGCLYRHTSKLNMPKGREGDAYLSLSFSPEGMMLSPLWLCPHCREQLRLETGVLCFCSWDSSAALPSPQHAGAGSNKAVGSLSQKFFSYFWQKLNVIFWQKITCTLASWNNTSNISVGLHYRNSINFLWTSDRQFSWTAPVPGNESEGKSLHLRNWGNWHSGQQYQNQSTFCVPCYQAVKLW